MKRVFITGNSGLIGRWVTRRFAAEGWETYGFDRHGVLAGEPLKRHYAGDILDYERLAQSIADCQPHLVIHLAARIDLEGKQLSDYDANITGVRNVCRAVRATPSVERAVYTSSQLVCRVGYIPTSDTDYCPNTVYGQSKVRTEKVVREEDGGGVTWCLARPTTVWGPYMNEHYQSLLHHIRAGRYFHPGKGELYKSYSYAENIAHQYFKLGTVQAADVQGLVFYMADYTPLSLRRYIDGLALAMGARKVPTVPLPLAKGLALAGDALNAVGVRFPFNSFRLRNIRTEYIFDMSRTERVCGPLPATFEQGVQATAAWFMAKTDTAASPNA